MPCLIADPAMHAAHSSLARHLQCKPHAMLHRTRIAAMRMTHDATPTPKTRPRAGRQWCCLNAAPFFDHLYNTHSEGSGCIDKGLTLRRGVVW